MQLMGLWCWKKKHVRIATVCLTDRSKRLVGHQEIILKVEKPGGVNGEINMQFMGMWCGRVPRTSAIVT